MANHLKQLVKEAHIYGTTSVEKKANELLDDIRLLNPEDINAIVEQYIEDTDDYHLHLVFNRCMNNRKLYDDSWEKIRAIEKAVALNLKHGLPLKGKQHEVAKTSGVWEFRMQHEDIQELG